MTGPLRIVVIAPSRHPLREPHAGGLERMVWERVRLLRSRGHEVLLCAPEGSDFLETSPPEFVLPAVRWEDARSASDIDYPEGHRAGHDDAVRTAMEWVGAARSRIDLIDNHNLHGIVLEAAAVLGIPILTTLHTPPLDELVQAHRDFASAQRSFVAVSHHTRAAWAEHGVEATVLPNTFDARAWSPGRGGHGLIWSGRIVPEKAPHLALEAARRAGRRIALAGRIGDHRYFDRHVRPLLGKGADYLGELGQRELNRVIGRADCALVTPMWPEPFGLVVAEALGTGTAVAAFDNGGVAEVLRDAPHALVVPPGDVEGLAAAAAELIRRGTTRPIRPAIRRHAVNRFSADRRVVDLETLFTSLLLPDRMATA